MTDAPRWILAERLFPGGGTPPLRNHAVAVADGRIAALATAAALPPDAPVTRCAIAAPGFVDLQINGGGGVMFSDAPDSATIATMLDAAREGGTAHILPTFVTAPGRAYAAALDAVARAMADGLPGVLGAHLEGPFLSPDRPGIHPRDAIRRMDDADADTLCGFSHPLLLTVAPEVLDDAHLVRLVRAGVRVFAGHSEATAARIADAAEAGLAGVTHLWNAMSQCTARAPGVVGAAFDDARLHAGIIADGVHVDPLNLRLAARLMAGRLFLVTDAMATLGAPDAAFSVGGVPIRRDGARLVGPDGTLAGAQLHMDAAVRTMIDAAGLRPEDALHMASGVPARAMGLGARLGMLAPGRAAHVTCLDADMRAQRVMVDGAWRWTRDG